MGKGVLIVDDAAFMRMLLKKIVTSNGYFVAGEAGDGNDAVEKYAQLKPELVTMDIVMPDKDGVEATKNIMMLDPGAKVIMCTAVGQQSMVMDAMKAGASGYIIKPFQAPKVLEEMNKVLS